MTVQAGGDARMAGGAVGGGIFAKTAKTPPLQSGFCGDIIAVASRPKAAHGRRHARTMPHMETCGFYHDAACHVATVFEKFALLD